MRSRLHATLRYAFAQSLPVLCGYLFIGFAFGLLLRQTGYGPLWAVLFAGLVYAGSLQFLLVSFLAQNVPLSTVALMSLFINIRHIFYGLSFLEPFQKLGRWRPYAIFGLTDETYSVLCSLKPPPQVDSRWAILLVTLLHHLYWIGGCALGSLAGGLPLQLDGIEFSMTALFLVIFLSQWESSFCHLPALLGLASSLLFLLLLGPDAFLLPSLLTTVGLLLLTRPRIEARQLAKETDKEGSA